jgi:hypothetical protein
MDGRVEKGLAQPVQPLCVWEPFEAGGVNEDSLPTFVGEIGGILVVNFAVVVNPRGTYAWRESFQAILLGFFISHISPTSNY